MSFRASNTKCRFFGNVYILDFSYNFSNSTQSIPQTKTWGIPKMQWLRPSHRLHIYFESPSRNASLFCDHGQNPNISRGHLAKIFFRHTFTTEVEIRQSFRTADLSRGLTPFCFRFINYHSLTSVNTRIKPDLNHPNELKLLSWRNLKYSLQYSPRKYLPG